MKNAIRTLEVLLIRAVANNAFSGEITEAENLAPGAGTVLLYFKDGTRMKVEISHAVAE